MKNPFGRASILICLASVWLGLAPAHAGGLPVIPFIPIIPMTYSNVEAPLQYVQYTPRETRTWTFRHPGAIAMRIRFAAIGFSTPEEGGYPEKRSTIEILNSQGAVVQTLTADANASFYSASVPGDVIQVRYTNKSNGGLGQSPAQAAPDTFSILGYSYLRLLAAKEVGGAPLNYSVFTPTAGTAYNVSLHNQFQVPVTVKKPYTFNDYSTTKVDLFLNGQFLGSSMGYRPAWDPWNIYFSAQLDMQQMIQLAAGNSTATTASASTLIIRETRYNGTDTNATWKTQYQYKNFPLTFSDPRATHHGNITGQGDTGVGNFDRLVIHLPSRSMVSAWVFSQSGGGSPFVDCDFKVMDANGVTLYEGNEAQVDGHGEGVSLMLGPGAYIFDLWRNSSSCVGYAGGTGHMYIKCDPAAAVTDH
ncbi:MAG TPA: hypothetical protein P5567_09075 [Kiritimatiellia bacterium]|nr:hypothetical protein [Kiritimatiellia bacterium]HRZ12593.1 hypothetical protein [Kiritimatiellia bacterium]HSA17671.1 hypothetical protein [Kiritimatiellia bacterium]